MTMVACYREVKIGKPLSVNEDITTKQHPMKQSPAVKFLIRSIHEEMSRSRTWWSNEQVEDIMKKWAGRGHDEEISRSRPWWRNEQVEAMMKKWAGRSHDEEISRSRPWWRNGQIEAMMKKWALLGHCIVVKSVCTCSNCKCYSVNYSIDKMLELMYLATNSQERINRSF